MEKVSLIIAAYNIEQYIEQCIQSCIDQTDKNIEIIVVNDASTDKTANAISRFEYDSRVKVIHHKENKGLSQVRKTGYGAATGKYVLFVDGDDWLKKNAVEHLRTYADENQCDIICFRFMLAFLDGKSQEYFVEPFLPIKGDEYLMRLLTGRIPPSIFTKFLRKSYVDQNTIVFPPPLNCGEDVALAASLGMHQPKAACIDAPLSMYRVRNNSLSAGITKCTLDVLPATIFVKNQLCKLDLYSQYENEFNYYAFLHNLYFKFDAMFTIPNPYQNQLKENWLSLGINISDNIYFKGNFSDNTPKNMLMAQFK